MAELTNFAGLTALRLGEGLDDDFLYRNIWVIDKLLQLGAVAHRHDGHAALADPATEPTVTISDAGGAIGSDVEIYVAYTLIDAQGGETLPSPPVLVQTGAGLPTPSIAPTLVANTAAGTLLANTYSYAVTVVDGLGGETALGPVGSISVPFGSGTNQIVVSGLDDILDETGATEWRLWRSVGGSAWAMLNQGGTDDLTDDGSFCADCNVTPPTTTTATLSTNRLLVTVPLAVGNPNVIQFAIYASTDGTFSDPSLLGTYPVADLGAEKAYPDLTLFDGAPPAVSLSFPGAAKINPDTEVLGNWKQPVANFAALPPAGNTNGDVRMLLSDRTLRTWDGDSWEVPTWSSAGAGGHVIQDENTNRTQRAKLSFQGDGVTVTDDGGNDRTVVTIDGDGGGGGPTGGPLDLGDGVQWQDGSGALALEVIGELLYYTPEDAPPYYNEFTFDGGAAAFEGSNYNRDGAGNLVPVTGNADLDVIHYLGGATGQDPFILREYEILSNDWHRLGVTIGLARLGLFAYIDRDAGEFQIRVKRVTTGNGTVGGIPDDEAEYEVIASAGAGEGWAAPAATDTGYVQMSLQDNKIVAEDWRDGNQEAYLEVEVPVDMLDYMGHEVLGAGVADWWDAAGAWRTPFAYSVFYLHKRQVRVSFTDGNSYVIFDETGSGSGPAAVGVDLEWAPDWDSHDGVGAGALYLPGAQAVKLGGALEKVSGAAPVQGETVATLATWAPTADTYVAILTGDDDGEEPGFLKLIGGSGEIQWWTGRSSDPAVKHPYIITTVMIPT